MRSLVTYQERLRNANEVGGCFLNSEELLRALFRRVVELVRVTKVFGTKNGKVVTFAKLWEIVN